MSEPDTVLNEKPKRARRDPKGRKRAIVEAAAGLIAREGTRKITHRRVAQTAGVPLGSTTQYFESIDDLRHAALAELGRQIEITYREMAETIMGRGGTPEAFADTYSAYLADTVRVESDSAFYAAAINDRTMRELARHAIRLSIECALPRLGETQATLLNALLDGFMVDACLTGKPIEPSIVRAGVDAIFALGDGSKRAVRDESAKKPHTRA